MGQPLLRKVDAVTFRVPDLDSGLAFYRDALGHALRWRNDEIGQAALSLPDSETEIVLRGRADREKGLWSGLSRGKVGPSTGR